MYCLIEEHLPELETAQSPFTDKKKVIKKGEMELATAMWNFWNYLVLWSILDAGCTALGKDTHRPVGVQNESVQITLLGAKVGPRWTYRSSSKKLITWLHYTNEMCRVYLYDSRGLFGWPETGLCILWSRILSWQELPGKKKNHFICIIITLVRYPITFLTGPLIKAKRANAGPVSKPFMQHVGNFQFRGPRTMLYCRVFISWIAKAFPGWIGHFLIFYHQFLPG